jgi:hypothetical protein
VGCTFRNCGGGSYGTIQVIGGMTFSRCVFYNNANVDCVYGQIYPGTFMQVDNCSLYRNKNAITVYQHYSRPDLPPRIVNCTIWSNTVAGIRISDGTSARVEVLNNILAYNARGVFENAAGDNAYLTNNCFYANGTNFWDEGATVRNTAAEINSRHGRLRRQHRHESALCGVPRQPRAPAGLAVH